MRTTTGGGLSVTAIIGIWLLAAGCGPLVDLVGLGDDLVLVFEVGEETLSETSDTATAAPAGDRIVVVGVISTPDPCQDITADADRSGDTILLTVEARSRSEVCAAVLAGFPYRAELGTLEPGTYTIRVVHAYAGTGWDAKQVLEETVVLD